MCTNGHAATTANMTTKRFARLFRPLTRLRNHHLESAKDRRQGRVMLRAVVGDQFHMVWDERHSRSPASQSASFPPSWESIVKAQQPVTAALLWSPADDLRR